MYCDKCCRSLNIILWINNKKTFPESFCIPTEEMKKNSQSRFVNRQTRPQTDNHDAATEAFVVMMHYHYYRTSLWDFHSAAHTTKPVAPNRWNTISVDQYRADSRLVSWQVNSSLAGTHIISFSKEDGQNKWTDLPQNIPNKGSTYYYFTIQWTEANIWILKSKVFFRSKS